MKRVIILSSPDSAVLRLYLTSEIPSFPRTFRSHAGRSSLLSGRSLAISAMILKSTPSWLYLEW